MHLLYDYSLKFFNVSTWQINEINEYIYRYKQKYNYNVDRGIMCKYIMYAHHERLNNMHNKCKEYKNNIVLNFLERRSLFTS